MPLPHGGNIYYYAKKYGIPEGGFLDFSASINPLGPPLEAIRALKGDMGALVNYPDPAYSSLKAALSERFGIDEGSILVGNGSTELIYLMPRTFKAGRALVMAPTFSDYERAARLAGLKVGHMPLRESDGFAPDMDKLKGALRGADLLFICNPNNPTGTLLEKEQVLDIMDAAGRAGAFTLIDEAFIEYAPGRSVVGEVVRSKRAAVLKNFTKFYGMPGLRVGYMVAHKSVVERLTRIKEPWTVGGLSEKAAVAALSDTAYEKKSLRLIEREKPYLYGRLADIPGLHPYRPSVNFMLVKLSGRGADADAVSERLASAGILIRSCSNFRGLGRRYIRVAVRTRRQNDALVDALRKNL